MVADRAARLPAAAFSRPPVFGGRAILSPTRVDPIRSHGPAGCGWHEAGGMLPVWLWLNWPYAWIGVAPANATGLVVEHFDQITANTERRTVESSHLWFRAHCDLTGRSDF